MLEPLPNRLRHLAALLNVDGKRTHTADLLNEAASELERQQQRVKLLTHDLEFAINESGDLKRLVRAWADCQDTGRYGTVVTDLLRAVER